MNNRTSPTPKHPADTNIESALQELPKAPGFSIVAINDCCDENERLRITARLNSLFNRIPIEFCGVHSDEHKDLEAAGCLIDAIDAKGGGASPGAILVNTAWREPEKSGDVNGSPFGYLLIGNLLINSTIRGRTLSLLKHFYNLESIRVLEPPEVLQSFAHTDELEPEWIPHIADSQFRSFTFQPLVTAWLCQGRNVPFRKENLACPRPGTVVWFIDKHGNCKTTVTTGACTPFPKDGDGIATRFGTLRYYRRLTDAPLGKPAIVTGSSGLGAGPANRFLEIVIRNGNAAKYFNISVGEELFQVY